MLTLKDATCCINDVTVIFSYHINIYLQILKRMSDRLKLHMRFFANLLTNSSSFRYIGAEIHVPVDQLDLVAWI